MIDVGYITYKENKYPVRISYKVIKALKAETGKNIEDVFGGDGGLDFELFETVLYHSLKVGAWYDKVEFEFDREDIEDMLDAELKSITSQLIALIPQFFKKEDTPEVKKKIQKK